MSKWRNSNTSSVFNGAVRLSQNLFSRIWIKSSLSSRLWDQNMVEFHWLDFLQNGYLVCQEKWGLRLNCALIMKRAVPQCSVILLIISYFLGGFQASMHVRKHVRNNGCTLSIRIILFYSTLSTTVWTWCHMNNISMLWGRTNLLFTTVPAVQYSGNATKVACMWIPVL